MKNTLEKQTIVLSSLCDAEGKLGVHNTFDCFMDLAAEHAAQLGVSYYDMLEHRCYWVAVRTRVRFYERPALGDVIRAETWPGKPGLAKSDRYYRLWKEDELLAEGRTEWAAQDIDTGAVRRTDSYGYPLELAHREERVCSEPFTRFKKLSFDDSIIPLAYTVGSLDIDVGRHMNNVAYIRMMMGTFSTSELASMDIREFEISYRLACYEGQRLRIYRQREGNKWLFRVENPDGETAIDTLIWTGTE